jgi:hypothetical protein
MKRLFIAVVLMVVSTAAFCQMFDGTIDGAIPGTMEDVSGHFIKKGYKIVNCPECPNSIAFMEGKLDQKGKKVDVLIYMEKDEDDFVYSVSLYYPKEENLNLQYNVHKKVFTNSFGRPVNTYAKRSEWVFPTYTYIIGMESKSVYHTLKINKQ